jgi:hypothetical protein
MFNFKWLLTGAAVGLLVSLAVGCGTVTKCTPASCPQGCCDAAGACQTPNSTQCGAVGGTCVACGLGQQCSSGFCVYSNVGGGTSNGGGTGSTGGGSGSTGGGSGSTGGGSGSTGGGTGTTGGGAATGGGGGSGNNAQCARLEAASVAFFNGRSTCVAGTTTLTKKADGLALCNASIGQCSSADRAVLDSYAGCLEQAPRCTTGNEQAAVNGFTTCLGPVFTGLSATCRAAVFSSSQPDGGTVRDGGP